jgi:adenosine deaminase-related growth factor
MFQNVIDALLLNATRMGHGYAIAKHPEAKRIAKEKNIPIEVNPISNQVLGLVKDLRNHPVAPLIQEGFPMVISADDPGLWDAKGLSYDYYSAFMALAGKTMNLKLLKKLVQNSLEYSTLKGDELSKCSAIVESRWASYMQLFQPKINELF